MESIFRCNVGRPSTYECAQAPSPPNPEPDRPDEPDRDKELPGVNPGSNPANPGDNPGVAEPGRPAPVVARQAGGAMTEG